MRLITVRKWFDSIAPNMTIEIGTRYIRTSAKGDQTIVIPKTEAEAKYHTELTNQGFTYKEVKVTQAPDSTCTSCEG